MGIAIMFLGIAWWAGWRIVPRWFGYKFVARKEALEDGTVVSLVRIKHLLKVALPPNSGLQFSLQKRS